MKDIQTLTAILFADLQGYSKIKTDKLKSVISDTYAELRENLSDIPEHFYVNQWGDGLLVCSYSVLKLARFALEFRDKIRNTDWKKEGFTKPLQIRIALHSQQIIVRKSGDKVEDVTGRGLDKTARIEPIVKPNSVYCSKSFYKLLVDEDTNIDGQHLGRQELAKGYGSLELYELEWEYDATRTEDRPEPEDFHLPKIRKQFSGKRKSDYITKVFRSLKNYFNESLEKLEKREPSLETTYEEETNTKFSSQVYHAGDLKCHCTIWLKSQHSQTKNIFFSESVHNYGEGSYNESITVEDDGFEVYLKLSLAFSLYGELAKYNKEKLSEAEVIEYLWKRFLQPLSY